MRQVYSDIVSTNNNIQKISFYSPSSGYIASTDNSFDWVGFTSDSGRTITKRFITLGNVNYNGYSVNLTFGFGIKGVKAFNQDTLIAYGDYGFVPSILYSTNGGLSYLLVFHSKYSLTAFSEICDMIFPQNNALGFAVDGYRILKTTDKGLSWFTMQSDANAPFDALDAIDNNNVFSFSTFANGSVTGKLVKSSNAGSTWQEVTIPDPHIYSADFLTASKGWLCVYHDVDSMLLYYTQNGGASWITKNHKEASPVLFDKMRFINDSTGFALGETFDTYKTSDTGRVWEPFPRDNNFNYLSYGHNDIQVINQNQLWSGGARDFLEINTNSSAPALPKAYFTIDTMGVNINGNVKLINYSKRNYTYKWYVNNALVSTNYNHTFTHIVSSQVDSIELIVDNGTLRDTLKKYQYFFVPNLPVITSFSPNSGSIGTSIIIRGTTFSGATSVKFGGVPANSFTILNDTTIRAIVGSGASGSVSVTDNNGTYSLAGFIYFPPPVSLPPVVSSFTPASGPIGTVITISGINFGSNPANNIIYFGATRGSVVTANATQITCTVPTGTSFTPISILNTSTNLIGYSKKPFNVTFADSSNFTTNSFTNTYNIDLGSFDNPLYIKGGDMDIDGKPDLLVAELSSFVNPLKIYRNTSPGGAFSFALGQTIGSTGNFSLGDLDNDGKPEIAIANNNFHNIAILRNLSIPGSMTFASPINFQTADGAQDVSISDLDNDGRPDLTVSGYNGSKVSVLRNTSSPGYVSFAEKIDFSTGGNTVACASGDIDGDGKNDIVTLNYINSTTSSFSYFRNFSSPGNLSFSAKTDISLPGAAIGGRGIWLADYDNDSKPDVIITNSQFNYFFRNTSTSGSISFSSPLFVSIPGLGHAGSVSNLSGDQKPDFLFGNQSFSYFTLFRNISTQGNIANDPPVNIQAQFPNEIETYFSDCIDFDLDGKNDIVASGANDHKISIYKNNIGGTIPFYWGNICANSTQQRTSDVSGTVYQWQQNTGGGYVNISDNSSFSGTNTGTLTIANIPLSWNGYLYRCIVDGSFYSSQFVLLVNTSLPPSVSISTPVTTICGGTTVVFTATGVNTSPICSYQWQVNGVNVGDNSPTFITNTLTNGSQVKVILFNPCSTPNSATSNVITMTVNGELPSVSISASSSTICAGTQVIFTATPTNSGGGPSYQWQVNGVNVGTNSPTYITNTLTNGSQVKVILTTAPTACGTNPPVTSNIITITVNNPLTPSVSISASSTTICTGTSVTFTATPANGGTGPSYQWQVNGVNAGTNSNTFISSGFVNGDQVKVIMTSNATCASPTTATSNTVTMTVNATVTPAVSISASSTNICSGTLVTFTATPTNGGGGPSYQWQVNGVNAGTNSNTFSISTLTNGAQVRVTMASNAACASPATATSNTVTMTVNASVTPSVTISASSTTICTGTSVTFTATPTNGGTSPTYQWQVNSVNAGINSNTFITSGLVNGDQIKVIMTSNATCASPVNATSNTVTITVNASITPSVSISASSTNICSGTSVTFTATTTNGGASPSYQWQVNGVNAGTNSNTFSTSILSNGTQVKVILTSSLSCAAPATANSNVIFITVNNSVSPAITISGNIIVLTGQSSSLTSSPNNGGTSPTYQWQDSTASHTWQNISGATSSTLNYTPSQTGNKVRCQLTSNANCASPITVTSNILTFTVNTVTAINPVPGSNYGIRYYPSPVNTVLFIDSLKLSDKWQTLEIKSMDGRSVISIINIVNRTTTFVNVDRLPGGLYIAVLRRKNGIPAYLKFIRQ